MEFIEGQNIMEFLKSNPHRLRDIFVQTINGFKYLEENNILHRDIRPDNLLVSENGIVKIIDFGFGKNINFENNNFEKSITLNWRFSPPNEFTEKIYDFRTEVYFVGKLFEEIIEELKLEDFTFSNILSEMTKKDFNDRLHSFLNVERELLSSDINIIEFQQNDKEIYQSFAHNLTSIFSKIGYDAEYNSNIENVIMRLDEVHRNSILEEFVQNPNSVAECFVKGNYRYWKKIEFPIYAITEFLTLIKSVSIGKKRIIVNNLWQRLDAIERFANETDDLPF